MLRSNPINQSVRCILKPIFSLFLVTSFSASLFGQSTEQFNPTPITENQIEGRIKARDIGDSRLTTYYFSFNASRGDIFVNVVASNFNGDIDIFSLEGMQPRTKITIYADSSVSETGRVIYMRKPEKMLLRIQGRPPNDDPASYQIKFAGSFKPLERIASNEDPALPEIEARNRGPVRVNSVGTIIEDPEAAVSENKQPAVATSGADASQNTDALPVAAIDPATDPEDAVSSDIPSTFDPRKKAEAVKLEPLSRTRPVVIFDDPFGEPKPKPDDETGEITVQVKKNATQTSAVVVIERVPEEERGKMDPAKEAELKAAALAKISLVITLKNGKEFKKRMSKVSSFNVFDGVLKVVEIDGEVTRFSILDVAKITID